MFWRLTLRQVFRHMEGRAKAREWDMRRAAWQAWTTASLVTTGFHSPKKFPDLEKVMPGERPPVRPMRADAIRAVLRARGIMKTPKG